APAAPAPAPRSGSAAVLTRLIVVLAVLAVAGGGIWLVTRAATPEASPLTTEIPALQVKAADVRPGSVAPAGGAVAGGAEQQTSPQQARSTGPATLSQWASQVAAVTN
ncbi:murein transglycosylase, partial [Amycolatopsis sp. SID8362]|nr:murein transglycosylase [Amycolatopsis sp. SID8362]NED40118.1 murein transglycosylase [Amycolatopsis sp. SID8362]